MKFLTTAAGVLALGLSATAGATVITFENDGGLAPTTMANSPGSLVPVVSQLSDEYISQGVLFTSLGGFAAVVNHGPNTPSPPAIIGGTNAGGALSYSAPITITFVGQNTPAINAIVSSIKVLGDLVPLGSGTVTMSAFDVDGALLGSTTVNDTGPIGTGPVLELVFAGIHRVVLSGTSGTVGFDNVEFDGFQVLNDEEPNTPVPLPGTLALMLTGLVAVGATRRRR